MEFLESSTSVRNGVVVYCVKADDGLHFYKSAAQANAEFPGAFDEPDDE